MAKKTETPQPAAEVRKPRLRLPRSLRKHIRLLKSEGRMEEAAGMHKTATEAKLKASKD
jgi:hypothetical protein